MAGIYIHIPFCRSKCGYCDFYSCTQVDHSDAYLTAATDELLRRRAITGGEPIETVYFGGGTPSLCTPQQIERLLTRVTTLYDTAHLFEITLEANPDDLSLDYLRALHAMGINRLSIGVQSFSDNDLRWMRRRHDSQTALHAIEQARTAGFDNLSIDLIYGLPHMTLNGWAFNLDRALSLEVEHLSAYHLTFEPETLFGRQLARHQLHACTPEQSQAQYDLLCERLSEGGYEHYEISNFARPQRRALHNSNYWNGTRYLGIGPAAHSFDGTHRMWNVRNLNEYLLREGQDAQYEQETLTPEQAYDELVMLSLRRLEGLDTAILEERFGARMLQYFCRQAERFVATGRMLHTERCYRIPPEFYLISDSIIADLFYTSSDPSKP